MKTERKEIPDNTSKVIEIGWETLWIYYLPFLLLFYKLFFNDLYDYLERDKNHGRFNKAEKKPNSN